MSPLPLLPDIETLAAGWLRYHPDLLALDARVATKTPANMTRPWVRVAQLDAVDDPRSSLEHLIATTLQVDCYAGRDAMAAHDGPMTAWRVKAATRAILKSVQRTTIDGVVVTKVRFIGDRNVPDETFEPAMDRYVLTVEITAHAV